ncbi:MAG: hypothetical protein HYV60_12715, partial [Planctomycetia bacterium]|nr:hypothetical protein [Planctomycetia bacterium]
MAYESVDQLQRVLTENVFHYAKDGKKAAGRALGTLVELITFYALKSWGFEHSIAIERRLPEFANDDITHNVEYSLHPLVNTIALDFSAKSLPLTARRILSNPALSQRKIPREAAKSNSLLSKDLILRNSCTIAEVDGAFINAYLDMYSRGTGKYAVVTLLQRPFAIFECKRVGVEEGMKKGPQTIEKAKQGA